ncbi:V-type ATP synthase subunit I [Spirochaeta thermophila]|uniref:V-type ATP synthase subunit I n=1 Tax=Winmispira thermophila (strain ATCC 49972 / DSM 6192 / RI 19.B1) TaxID=665571 RepID=E0RT08_WINT6|nr:ATPase [Spirochaeta thermophila]ADN02145.1 hypothetical protein STHERM_c12040 [Spirochaeta thermophila DSM 6192]
MIVPMTKVFLVMKASEAREALTALRRFGAVHVHVQDRETDEVEARRRELERCERALGVLAEYRRRRKGRNGSRLGTEEVCGLVDRVLSLAEERRRLEEEAVGLSSRLEELGPWGDVSDEDIAFLREHGVHVVFCLMTGEQRARLGKDLVCVEVGVKGGRRMCVVVGRGEEPALPEGVEVVRIPKGGRAGVRRNLMRVRERVREVEEALLEAAGSYEELVRMKEEVVRPAWEFERVAASLEQEGPLVWLTGFLPEREKDRLADYARKQAWGALFLDPGEDDPVPTLVENPRAIRIIRPLFDFLDIVPGYREFDISFVFLAFLSVFFAMIVGDAGYGLIFLASSLYILRREYRLTGKVTDAGVLIAWMSLCTVVWGALTGTWFGYEGFARTAPFSWFVVEGVSSWEPEATQTVQLLSFGLGLVHLSIAHLWRFVREIRDGMVVRSFSQLGWLSIIWGLFNVVLNLVVDAARYPILPVSVYGIAIGLLLVVVFGSQEGDGFLKGVARGFAGLFTTVLDVIGSFGDLISYIRLFAVGLATVALAEAFNTMALGAGGSLVGILIAGIILLIGHGLNLVMSALSVVVHGVRLNLLEFAGHLGMEWTGIHYTPFKEPTTPAGDAGDEGTYKDTTIRERSAV